MQSIDKGYLSVRSESIQHYYQHKPDVICLSIKAYLHLTRQGGSNCPSQTASYHQTYIIDNFIIRENNFHRFVLNIYETKTEDRARRRERDKFCFCLASSEGVRIIAPRSAFITGPSEPVNQFTGSSGLCRLIGIIF